MNQDLLRKVLNETIRLGGAVIKSNFDADYKVYSKKTVNDLVTEIDKKAEDVIISNIKKYFPEHQILSEEIGSMESSSDYKWIIDPIDGTVNFVHGIPICCVSIGIELEDTIIMGAVYNPMLEELFFAQKGEGASLNGRTIKVSSKKDIESSCLVTGFPYRWADVDKDPVKVFETFIRQGLPVRRLGSAAIDLCWVACGRFDGFWEYNLNPWDIAAGYLIIEEAGGQVTNFVGEPYSVYDKQTLATNGKIHDDMLRLIKDTE